MTTARSRQTRLPPRGFSLLEIVIALTILAAMIALAVPGYKALTRRGQVNQQMRYLMDDLAFARSQAGSGYVMQPSQARVRSAGVRILSTTSYEVIATDSPTGSSPTNTDILKVVVFNNTSNVQFTNPTTFPTDIMFKSNGTLASGSPALTVLKDATTNNSKTLTIALTGVVRIAY
jgi:prepilin-type N-terminal cleavage/methylation domain-containing protein